MKRIETIADRLALVLFLILYLAGINGYTQKFDIEYLSKEYQLKSTKNENSECHLDYINTLDSSWDTRIDQIVLIRHGKPLIDKKGWFSSEDAQAYSKNYDLVGVEKINKNPFCISNHELDTVFTSNLVRAINTSEQIFGNQDLELLKSKLFREFEREIFFVPVLKMPLNFWLISSRVLWYVGLSSRNIENKRMAHARLNYGTAYLEKSAHSKGAAVLVAHGMYNKAMSKKLKKTGWTLIYEEGNGYLSVKILAKNN